MPILLPPRQPAPAPESFLLKSVLVASALFMFALLVVREEFYVSSPGHSLSEVEVALRLALQ